GYAFKLAIPQSAFSLFRREDLSVAERVLAKSIYELGNKEEALKYGRGGADFSNAYHCRLRRILDLPHSRCLA
ncbi:hypothetical protein B0H11DRAFT_1664444, partial [Mycena galericulata]